MCWALESDCTSTNQCINVILQLLLCTLFPRINVLYFMQRKKKCIYMERMNWSSFTSRNGLVNVLPWTWICLIRVSVYLTVISTKWIRIIMFLSFILELIQPQQENDVKTNQFELRISLNVYKYGDRRWYTPTMR